MIGWSDLPGIELWSIKVLLSGTAPGSHQDQGAVGAAADVWAHPGLFFLRPDGHPSVVAAIKDQCDRYLHVIPYGEFVQEPQVRFAERLTGYRRGKGSIQFPLGDPVPADLLRDLIAHRVQVVGAQLPPIGRPATAALAGVGITGWSDLAGHTADELLALHGVGPKAITILNAHGANL